MKKHRLFMNAEEVKTEICRLFTPDQKNTLEEFLTEDPKTSYLSEVFRNFDLRCLLSTAYISDPVLESYQHTLTVSQSDVYFVPLTLFKYLKDFCRPGKKLLECCDFVMRTTFFGA